MIYVVVVYITYSFYYNVNLQNALVLCLFSTAFVLFYAHRDVRFRFVSHSLEGVLRIHLLHIGVQQDRTIGSQEGLTFT